MQSSEEEGRYFKFFGEHKIYKNQNEEIKLPEDTILPVRTTEECVDFTYPALHNPTELFYKNCILVPLNEMMIKINSTCIKHFPGMMK